MNSIGPTTSNIPFHVAQAYGLGRPAQIQRPAAPTQISGAVSQARVAAGSGGVGGVGAVGGAGGAPPVLPSTAQKLVAAQVPGRVDFSGDQPAPAPGTLAMYRHPADKNAAATAVSLGRSLDVRG